MRNISLSVEDMIKDFGEKYGHYQSKTPNFEVPEEVRQLRINLIKEEFEEMIDGLKNNDLVEIADGAADLVYVVVGTCITFGIDFDRIFREVHRSNMTKTAVKAPKGKKYGTKTPKGPDYIAPDVRGILIQPHKNTELEINSL